MWQLWAILAGARNGRHPEEGFFRSVNWAAGRVLMLLLAFVIAMGVWATYTNHQRDAAMKKYWACVATYGGVEAYIQQGHNIIESDQPCGTQPDLNQKY